MFLRLPHGLDTSEEYRPVILVCLMFLCDQMQVIHLWQEHHRSDGCTVPLASYEMYNSLITFTLIT